ncbi:MAG: type II toxin-antitoxin system HicA family toxin [Candidatus Eremiobacterota bacterium]
MTGKEMIKKFKQNGWSVVRVTGSHYRMMKNGCYETIPHHTKELGKGIEKSLLKTLKEAG